MLNRIESVLCDEEKKVLSDITASQKYSATLLPIRTVGVQVPVLGALVCVDSTQVLLRP